MFVPGVHQGLHVRVPRRAITFAIALLAIVTVVVAWAALDARPTSREHLGVPASPLPVGTLGSVALLVPEGPVDHLFVQRAASDATRSFITDFPSTFTLHAHGAASPMGDRVAVLWVDGQPGSARLTIVDLRSGDRVETPGTYSYLSTLSWSRDGLRVAALAAARPDASGRFRATVVEIDAASGVARPVAEFDSVLAAAPVGYSADSTRLLVVTIDQSGSAVWSAGDGKLQNVAQLSAGRTQDWRLSPDAARLAFTQVYGAGATRAVSGRVLTILTRNIVGASGVGDQLGATWRAGFEAPVFGGPGGDVQLAAGADGEYLVPTAWSPDGSGLVANVYDRDQSSSRSLQYITAQGRFEFASEIGASFLGFVVNLD